MGIHSNDQVVKDHPAHIETTIVTHLYGLKLSEEGLSLIKDQDGLVQVADLQLHKALELHG